MREEKKRRGEEGRVIHEEFLCLVFTGLVQVFQAFSPTYTAKYAIIKQSSKSKCTEFIESEMSNMMHGNCLLGQFNVTAGIV